MNKDSYNIDSILEEVKKKREETEKANENVNIDTQKADEIPADEPAEVVEEETAPAPEPAPTDEPAPAEEVAPIEEPTPEEAPVEEPPVEEAPAEELTEAPEEPNEFEELSSDELVDIFSVDDEDDQKGKKKKGKKKNKKKKKILWIIIAILLVAVIGIGIYAYHTFNQMLDQIANNKSGYTDEAEHEAWGGMDKLVENFDPIYETEADQLSSLQDMIKTWYNNGAPCSSSHVLNILLIGEDTRGTEILDDGTRADSAIIASINVDTKKITLTSILRDTYAYFEATPNNEETGQFEKINGAMSIGDINAYINCVQNLYKIKIDNYVIVNFDSFKSIVDTLGGVTLEITSAEINEINSHPKRYGDVYIEQNFDGRSGEMELTGEQALAYCRIRKLDSDNMRADRQKKCLIKIFEQAKDASNIQLLKLLKSVTPYIATGFDKNDLTKLAEYAIKEKWMGFKTQMTSVPEARINESGAGGIFYGAWCWKSDFPQDAYDLQMLIYGKSNITLAHTRVDVLRCAERGFYANGDYPIDSYATIVNDHYGEVTTTELVSEKEEEETTTAN